MTEAGPPHLVADEFATLRALFDFQRESFVRKVSGVSDEAASRSTDTRTPENVSMPSSMRRRT